MGPDSPWGMVLHYPNEHLIDLLYQGGVSWLRTGVRFETQRGPGQTPQWGDAVISVRAAYQGPPPTQEVYLGLDPNYPDWIVNAKNAADKSPWINRLQHWASFVRLAVSTFGGDQDMRVRYFHIGNEPNDKNNGFFRFGEDEYMNLLVTAIQTIRSMAPAGKYKVCAPDIATGAEHDPWNFLRRCLSRVKAAGGLDVVTIHGYVPTNGSASDLMRSLRPAKSVLSEQGVAAPVWLTETGVSNFSSDASTQNGQRVRDVCAFIGDGTAPRLFPFPPEPKFLKKAFFFVWSEDEGEAGRESERGKYAWLARTTLAPNAQLWDAYMSVTGERFAPKPRNLNAVFSDNSVPGRMRPNESRAVTIRVTNVGRQRWAPELNFGLGFLEAGGAKPTYKLTRAVEPNGGFYDFNFTITAPPVAGRYEHRWQMYQGALQFGPRMRKLITVE